MKWMMMVLMAATLGATTKPTTKPTTAPVLIEVGKLQDAVLQAKAFEQKVSGEARVRWLKSAEYKMLNTDMEANLAKLEKARAGKDAQAKLDASKAYVDAKRAYEAAENSALVQDHLIALARADVIDSERKLNDAIKENGRRVSAAEAREMEAAKEAAAEEEAKDPIKRAIKEGRIVLGMTLDQAQKSCPMNKLSAESKDQVEYVFYESGPVSAGRDHPARVINSPFSTGVAQAANERIVIGVIAEVHAVFVDGKIVRLRRY